MLGTVGQPHRCRRPLGTATHNPIQCSFQIGEFESSANTVATCDDEISRFFSIFPLEKKRNDAMAFMTCTLKKKMNSERTVWRRKPNNLNTRELLAHSHCRIPKAVDSDRWKDFLFAAVSCSGGDNESFLFRVSWPSFISITI